MNIFWLSLILSQCAKDHCDKHCVKMILETAQLLYSSHDYTIEFPFEPYKKTHINHPCSKWVREEKINYRTLSILGLYLCKEYTNRYDKIHKTQKHLIWLSQNIPESIPGKVTDELNISKIPLCMPEKYKIIGDPVASYRAYYLGEKMGFAKWSNDKPNWLVMSYK